MVREGRVLISVATDPDFGSSYYVTAYEVGAQVTSGSSGNTVAVRAGHGFAAGDKFIVGTSTAQFKTILSVTSTQLTLAVATTVTVVAGDLLVNLAADTGSSLPNYDGAGLTIYTDMDYSNVATNNTVQTDANGKYRYYHKGIARWELVRSSLTAPIALYTDTGGLILEASSSPVATGYPLTNVTDVLIKWYRTGDANPLLSFSPLAVDGQYAQLLRVGDRAQTSGDSRVLGYFSAAINSAGAVESQALYGINVYTGASTVSQMGVHGIAQSIPGSGLTQESVVGVQGYAYHLDTAGGTTTNLFGSSATVETGTGATYTGAVTNMIGVRGNARNLAASVSSNQMVGVWGLVSDITGPVVQAYGGRFDQPVGATTQNHAIVAYGTALASIGFTNDLSNFKYIRYNASTTRFETIGAWLCQGSFTSTSAITAQLAGNAVVVGANTDANIAIAFDTLTTEAHITYTGASTNVFDFDRPVTVTGAVTASSNVTSGGYNIRSVAAAVTASTTQTQAGGTALTKDINNVSVCANANDTVTLPTAAAGMSITIFNNGAQTLRIYPASGDNLGTGVDTLTTLAAAANVTFTSFDATNWEIT